MRRYKFTDNLGLKIMALVFSALLWLIVANVDNPIGSSTFSNIPVQIKNDDIITSAGEVYQIVSDDTVSVVVYANREIRQKLSSSDIVATADISEMDTSTNLIPITITIPNYEGKYESATAVPRNLRIQREKSGRKVLSLTAETDGSEPKDGYTLGDLEVDPDSVTITGPESALAKIDRAVARVKDLNGLTKDTKLKAELVLYDKNGNELGQTQLANNLGDDGLTVSVEILQEKTVPVKFDVSGTPADGYRYTGGASEPESIRICGKGDDIDKVDEISIPASAVSIEGATEPVKKTIDISQYLPDGVRLVDENGGQIKVTATIEEEGTRTIDILVSSIKINNLDSSLGVSYKPDAEVSLRFRGDQSALDVLDISNAVSVDLSGYTKAGTYEVPVQVNIPDHIELLSTPSVSLNLTEKTENETEESAPSDGE